MRAQFVLSEMLIGLRRNMVMTVAVVLTVGVSLGLFGVGLLLRSQINTMKDYWYDKVEVSVFLCSDGDAAAPCNGKGVTQDQRDTILQEIRELPQVKNVFYESKEDAYSHFKEQFKSSPELVNNTTADQLPESYRVKLKDPTRFEIVRSALEGRPGVNSVIDQRAILERFFKLLNGLRNVAFVIAFVQIIACVILVANIIRLAAFSRRRETQIMRLVGASNFYIQLPFLLEGAVAGFAGGLLACAVVALTKWLLIDGILRGALSFTAFIGWGAIVAIIPVLLVAGVLISAMAAFVTLSLSKALRA